AERSRMAATARSVGQWLLGPYDADHYARVLAPDVESVDHRILGTWSARGAEVVARHIRSLLNLTDDYTARHDDVLALRSDACILRRITSGTDRIGAGGWESPYLGLLVFGPDGLVTRWEQFEIDREADALARFDELVSSRAERPAPAARPLRVENAATRAADRFVAASAT